MMKSSRSKAPQEGFGAPVLRLAELRCLGQRQEPRRLPVMRAHAFLISSVTRPEPQPREVTHRNDTRMATGSHWSQSLLSEVRRALTSLPGKAGMANLKNGPPSLMLQVLVIFTAACAHSACELLHAPAAPSHCHIPQHRGLPGRQNSPQNTAHQCKRAGSDQGEVKPGTLGP